MGGDLESKAGQSETNNEEVQQVDTPVAPAASESPSLAEKLESDNNDDNKAIKKRAIEPGQQEQEQEQEQKLQQKQDESSPSVEKDSDSHKESKVPSTENNNVAKPADDQMSVLASVSASMPTEADDKDENNNNNTGDGLEKDGGLKDSATAKEDVTTDDSKEPIKGGSSNDDNDKEDQPQKDKDDNKGDEVAAVAPEPDPQKPTNEVSSPPNDEQNQDLSDSRDTPQENIVKSNAKKRKREDGDDNDNQNQEEKEEDNDDDDDAISLRGDGDDYIDNNSKASEEDNEKKPKGKPRTYKKRNVRPRQNRRGMVIQQLDRQTLEVLAEYATPMQAAIATGVTPSAIYKVANGERGRAGAYKFRYAFPGSGKRPSKRKKTPKNTKIRNFEITRVVQKICPDLKKVLSEHECINDAAASVNLSYQSVYAALRGIQPKAGGFEWKYRNLTKKEIASIKSKKERLYRSAPPPESDDYSDDDYNDGQAAQAAQPPLQYLNQATPMRHHQQHPVMMNQQQTQDPGLINSFETLVHAQHNFQSPSQPIMITSPAPTVGATMTPTTAAAASPGHLTVESAMALEEKLKIIDRVRATLSDDDQATKQMFDEKRRQLLMQLATML